MATVTQKTVSAGEGDFPYFRRLWNQVVLALMGAAFLPLILIGGGMYYFAASALTDHTLHNMGREVARHRAMVDRFLAERIMDLKMIAETRSPFSLQQPGELKEVFKAMQSSSTDRIFSDLGIFDQDGNHLAYVGPHNLLSRNYRDTEWFRATAAYGVHVSDVFSGFRQVPHFIIAVKGEETGTFWMIRATVDAVSFKNLVGRIIADSAGDCFLVNKEGRYQSIPLGPGRLMANSAIGEQEFFEGIRLEETDGKIRAKTWLAEVPWLCVVEMDRNVIFKLLRQVRNVGVFIFILGAILIGFTVLLTANHLVTRLEVKRKNLQVMGYHLREANKMTLSLKLHNGFFQEISEALVNIDSATAWMGTQIQSDRIPADAGNDLGENLSQIKGEIARSRKAVRQMLQFSRPTIPAISDIDINRLISRTAALFQREARFNNISIIEDYKTPMTLVRSDWYQLEQVFQNLLVNALDAVEKNGSVTLKTSFQRDIVQVVVSDSGPGVSTDHLERIFEPLFTTHPGRLGLGLVICREILKKLGGEITVASKLGEGAAFTVTLPFRLSTTRRG